MHCCSCRTEEAEQHSSTWSSAWPLCYQHTRRAISLQQASWCSLWSGSQIALFDTVTIHWPWTIDRVQKWEKVHGTSYEIMCYDTGKPAAEGHKFVINVLFSYELLLDTVVQKLLLFCHKSYSATCGIVVLGENLKIEVHRIGQQEKLKITVCKLQGGIMQCMHTIYKTISIPLNAS